MLTQIELEVSFGHLPLSALKVFMSLESSQKMLECRELIFVQPEVDLALFKAVVLDLPRFSPICTMMSSLTLYCFRSVYGEAPIGIWPVKFVHGLPFGERLGRW